MAYSTKVYRTNGGDKLVVASSGILDVESGGLLQIAGVTVTASAADLNTASGGSTGTTSATFTVDSDSGAAKFKLDTNSATGNFTLKLVPPNLGGNITLTLPASTGTIALTSDTATNLDLGSSGVAGSLDIFPTTALNGKMIFTATDMGGAWNLAIANDAIGAARAYRIPDAGGDGKFVMTTAANSLLVNCNGSDRTMSLAGNVTLAGALTTAGAFAVQFTMPGAFTYTFPSSSCTLLSDPGDISGTTVQTFTVDSDNATGKFALKNTTGGTNHTVTLQTSTTTQAVTLSLPDVASDTLVTKTSTDVMTNKTLTAPVINGATTAAAANNFTLNTGSGAFTTPTGTFTFYGAVATNGNNNYDFSASSGAFSTATGVNTLSGAVTIASGKAVTHAGGVANIDFSASSGTFLTSTGTNTLGGNVSIAAAKNLSMAAGAGAIDFSAATGTFKTSTNTNTLSGNTVVADGKTLVVGSAAGGVANAFTIFSATAANGSFKLNQPNNAGNWATTFQPDAAIGQATAYQLPDPGGANGEVVVTTGSNQLLVNCNASDRTMSLAGNVTLAAAFISVGANSLTLTTTGVTNVTVPTSGTLATLGGVETLTSKVIDGDNNTLQDISPTVAKQATPGTTGVSAIPSMPMMLTFTTAAGAETVSYTVPAGKTLRVLDVRGYKTAAAGGAGGTVTVKNAATAITDGINLNIADKAVFAAATYDDAQHQVAAGAALNVVTAGAAVDLSCVVNVLGVWV